MKLGYALIIMCLAEIAIVTPSCMYFGMTFEASIGMGLFIAIAFVVLAIVSVFLRSC